MGWVDIWFKIKENEVNKHLRSYILQHQ